MAMRKQIISQVLHSRAASTIKSSLTQYRKFTNFVKEFQIPGKFPYTTLVISHYLSHLIETKKSYSITLQSQCAIKWVHDLVPLASNPADAPLIHNIIEAGKRSPRTTSCKKEPISIDTLGLAKTVAKYATPDSELKDLRTALLCVLCVLLCVLTSIKAKDITVNPDHLIIFVSMSKTDQYRNGNQVFIAQTNGHLCPHALLLRYFSLASIHPDSDEYILRSLQASRRGTTATALASKRLSYTRLREIIKAAISSIGLDPKQCSAHSLRSGGVSFMANSQGNNPNLNRLLKLQGRWKSDTSKDMYVKDSLESRLTLTKTLPIIGNIREHR